MSSTNQPIRPNRVSGLRKTETLGENPKDSFGLSKVPLSLIPASAKILMAAALGTGAIKYGEYNWRISSVRLRVYIEAAQRHLDALLDGQDYDDESGLPHIAHVLACGAIIADGMYGSKNPIIDDRPVEGNAEELMRKYNGYMKQYAANFETQFQPLTNPTKQEG